MSRPQIPARTSLRQLLSVVAESPAAEKVLERYGVDYWFGGSHTLEEGCERAAVSPVAVAEQLCKLSIRKGTVEALTATHLVELICSHFDDVIKPLLHDCFTLLRDLRASAKHRDLGQTAQLFRCIDTDARDHILLGRNHLFPYFVALETSVSASEPMKAMKLASFWRSRMANDHNDFADNLKELRRLFTVVAADLGVPEAVAPLHELTAELQRQLHHHVLLEYQFLFPLSVHLEKSVKFVEEKGNGVGPVLDVGVGHKSASS